MIYVYRQEATGWRLMCGVAAHKAAEIKLALERDPAFAGVKFKFSRGVPRWN